MDRIKILIIDDHPIITEGLEFFLGQDPRLQIVGTAADFKDGLEKFHEDSPNLVILDLSMPKINGFQAIKLLRDADPEVKILIFSAHAQEDFVYDALKAGANGYAIKKGSFEELKQAIQYIMNGGYWVHPEFSQTLLNDFLNSWDQQDKETSPLAELTSRERQVFRLMANGLETAEIGEKLCISSKTVAKHRVSMMRKLNVTNHAELVKFAIQHKLVDL